MEKIKISDIPEDGIHLSDMLSVEEIGFTDQDYLFFVTPVTVRLFLKKVQNVILSQVKVESRFQATCARSLESVQREWQESFNLDFEIQPGTEEIDLAEDIRQEVILRVPMRVLSDKEQAKEIDLKRNTQIAVDQQEADTYQPFANLKDTNSDQ